MGEDRQDQTEPAEAPARRPGLDLATEVVVKVLTCVWCGGTGEDPLFDVPDPADCIICEGLGGYRIVRDGDRYLGYEPMDPTQLEIL